jgi:hypothetical protein
MSQNLFLNLPFFQNILQLFRVWNFFAKILQLSLAYKRIKLYLRHNYNLAWNEAQERK